MNQAEIVNSLHDAQIRGILLTAKNSANLLVELTDHTRRSISFNDVKRLRVENFREGNTILEFSVTRGEDIDPADVAYAYDLDMVVDKFLGAELNRLRQGDWLVIKIEPSFGCFAICICKSWNVNVDFRFE